MRKKIVNLFLIVAITICLTACGKSGYSILSKELKASDLSIEDFKWETNSSKCNSLDCYVLSLTNNSKYDIIGVDFSYKVKDDVTNDELLVYEDFMKKHDSIIDEEDTAKDVTLRTNKNVLVKKGEQITGLGLTIGFQDLFWYDYPTEAQFKLMEPKELQIGIVSGKKLYIAYYNFQSKTWKLDENQVDVDIWAKEKIGKTLNKPNVEHFMVIYDEEDIFKAYAYGATKETYKKYVEELKNEGFKEDDEYSSISTSRFEGTNTDENTVEVWYYESEQRMIISIYKY